MVRIPKEYDCPSNGFILIEHSTHDSGSLDITIDGTSINFSNHAWNGGAGGLATIPVYKGAHVSIPIDHDNEKWAPGGSCVGWFVATN